MKQYPNNMSYEDLWPFLEEVDFIHLATIENGLPRVRMMATTKYDNKLWVVTWTHWDKVRQLKENNRIEFSAPFRVEGGIGCARGIGTAEIVADEVTRKQIADNISWFEDYWGKPNNPEYTVIRLNPEIILLDHPLERNKYTIKMDYHKEK